MSRFDPSHLLVLAALSAACNDLVIGPPHEDAGDEGGSTSEPYPITTTSPHSATGPDPDAGTLPDPDTSTSSSPDDSNPESGPDPDSSGPATTRGTTIGESSSGGGDSSTSSTSTTATSTTSTSTEGSTSTTGETTSETSTSDGGGSTTTSTDSGATTTDGGSTGGTSGGTSDSGASSSSDGGTTGGQVAIGLPYQESFDGLDGSPWPAPWSISNPAVLLADLDSSRARLQGETATTSRMVNTAIDALDVDAVFTVRFESYLTQGAGFYVRQNGGTLDDTIPHGQGYAVFVEGGFLGLLGLWREVDGVEEVIATVPAPVVISDGLDYRIRIQCQQDVGFTWLRTRMWALGDPEPMSWDLETTDATAELQDQTGGLGADVYEYESTPLLWFDDVEVIAL